MSQNNPGSVSFASNRGWWRATLALLCVVAIVVSSVALPLVAGGIESPASDLLTNDALGAESADAPERSGSMSGDAGGGMSALAASERTTVGTQDVEGASNPLRNQSAEIHFIVQSTQPAYWRTGSFDQYDGQGWSKSESPSAFTGVVPREGVQGERVDYRITLARPATALPTVWTPRRISLPAEGLELQSGRSIASTTPIEAGTMYQGTSYRPPSDPSVLRSAGTAYPAGIEERYTQLPSGERTERIAAFTAELVANDTSPYDTAKRIERWLQTNKEYSLNASHDPTDGTVASQFLFEMDAGYCEYFATTMVAMLRSADIPARYVVGYSTGQQTGENEYTVRGMNAHAWVEVYFPEVGWVAFDPTPASDRRTTEREAFANQTGASSTAYAPPTGSIGTSATSTFTPSATGTESGAGRGEKTGTGTTTAPTGTRTATGSGTSDGTASGSSTDTASGTSDEPDGGTATATDTGPSTPSGSPTETTSEATSVDPTQTETSAETPTETSTETPTETDERSTETDSGRTETQSPTPTRTSAPPLEVSLNRTPVPGAMVEVQVTRAGEPVAGATVRFNDHLVGTSDEAGTVVATVPYSASLIITVEPPATSRAALGLPPDGTSVRYALSRRVPKAARLSVPESNGNGTRTYTLETDASVALVGDVRSNATVTLVATVADSPVREAAVSIDGERLGQTGSRGRASLHLPAKPGTYTITVRRGAVEGTVRVTIHELTVERAVGWPVALPYAPTTVTARLGNDTLAGATVTVGGEPVGTTGVNGSAVVRLPPRAAAQLGVSAYGQRARTTVDGLLTNLGAVVAGGLLVVGAGVRTAHRRGVAARSLPWRLLGGLMWLLHRFLSLLVLVATSVVDGVTGLRRLVRQVRDRVIRLRHLPLIGRRAVTRAVSSLARFVHGIGGAVWIRLAGRVDSDADGSTRTATRRESEEERAARLTVHQAWVQFVALLPLRSVRTRTPGEIARIAIEDCRLPADPVETLRDGYRDVAYGGVSPSARIPGVERALRRLVSTSDDETEGDARPPEQGGEAR